MTKQFASAKFRSFFTALILLFAAGYAFAQSTEPFSMNNSPLPAPTGFVNDYAGVIDAATKQKLETRLKEFKEKTNPSIEIAVAVVKTTGDRPIFEYSLAVARGWKIGSKEDDNPSALLFVAIDDRKYFTQVSKDLEDELPDGAVGSLQRQFLVPEFKKGNYAKGISDTIDAYIRTIEAGKSGTEVPARGKTVQPQKQSSGAPTLYSIFCCLVIIGVILLIIFSIFSKKGKGGGGFGGGGSALPWVIGSILASGGSGGSSSSTDWGGGDSSGGFGGFGGGGDFGGGGSGGSW